MMIIIINYAKKVVSCRVENVRAALSNWKNLPLRKNKLIVPGLQFQAGLIRFVERIKARSFSAFKNQLKEGKKIKEMAAIQLIEIQKIKQLKTYYAWQSKANLCVYADKIKGMYEHFKSLSFAIKSNSDLIFLDDGTKEKKEKAILKLYSNIYSSWKASLDRWREVN